MQLSPVSVPRLAGVVAALHALLWSWHWVWPLPWLSAHLPGAGGVGLVNPLLFVAVAVCFWGATDTVLGSPRRWLQRLGTACAALLVLVASVYLLGSLSGLPAGLDAVLRPADPPSNLPLRLSPNATLAFLLTGSAFLCFRRPLGKLRKRLFVTCASGVALIGLGGMVGHLLGLEALYRLADFNRILLPTAVTFAVVSAGLWGLHEAVQEVPLHEIEGRIGRRTVAVLALVALGSGVAGFALLRENFESVVWRNLQLTATTSSTSLAHTLQVGLQLPRTIATRPAVIQALDRIAADPTDTLAQGVLQRVADNIASELDRVEFHSAAGTQVAQSGTRTRDTLLVTHALRGAGEGATLGWNQAYLLVTRHDVRQDGRLLGSLVTEQRLPLFDRLLAEVRVFDENSDAVVCGVDGPRAACAPTRFRREVFTIPLLDAAGQPASPVVHALQGQIGVRAATDPRGVAVVSAHAPLGDLGLGLAVTTDVATLHAPLRSRVVLLALSILSIIALAIYALRSQVRPVMSRLADSERSLQESQARLAARERLLRDIADNVPALVSHIDSERRYTFANAQFGALLGMDPAQMIGRTVRELRPEVHDTVLEPHLSAALRGEARTFDGVGQVDGRDVHYRVSYVPDIGPDGGVRGCYSLSIDTTALREAEQAALQARRAADQVAEDLRLLFDAMPASLSLWSGDGRLLGFNQRFAALHARGQDRPRVGQTLEAMLRDAVRVGRIPEARGCEDAWIAERLRQFAHPGEPTLRAQPQGGWRRLLEVKLPDGRVLGHSVDVTELVTAQAEAATARQRLNDAIEALPAGFELYDAQDRLILVNSTMKALYPGIADLFEQRLTFAELVRANWERGGLNVPDVEAWLAERQRQRAEGSGSRTHQLAGGRWVRAFDRRTQEGGIVGVRIEVTEMVERDRELARLNDELRRMADTDALTLIANRRRFERRLAEALAESGETGSPLALVMFDVDYFKRFNDRHGHPAGDTCLRRVAAVLMAVLRGPRDLAARLGGEEFAVLLPGVDAEGACITARRCMDLLRDAAIAHGDSPLGEHVTLSAGIAVLRAGETGEQLIARADAALYEAKLAGRARWHLAD